jgi:hypothetical protein
MDWQHFGEQQDGPADASEQWVERVMGAEASLAQQQGDTGRALDALAKLFVFRAQNRRA